MNMPPVNFPRVNFWSAVLPSQIQTAPAQESALVHVPCQPTSFLAGKPPEALTSLILRKEVLHPDWPAPMVGMVVGSVLFVNFACVYWMLRTDLPLLAAASLKTAVILFAGSTISGLIWNLPRHVRHALIARSPLPCRLEAGSELTAMISLPNQPVGSGTRENGVG